MPTDFTYEQLRSMNTTILLHALSANLKSLASEYNEIRRNRSRYKEIVDRNAKQETEGDKVSYEQFHKLMTAMENQSHGVVRCVDRLVEAATKDSPFVNRDLAWREFEQATGENFGWFYVRQNEDVS